MKILIIDNYDSFTGNLYQLFAQVSRVEPSVARNDSLTLAAILDMNPDAIVISPGPGRPENTEDFGVCAEVIRHAEIPILGVCLGFQGIAHAFGGRVQIADYPLHGARSAISHCGSDLFDGIDCPFDAVRYHSLEAVLSGSPELVPLAHADDGTLMAIKHCSRPVWGVQFHPESIGTEEGQSLVENFLRLASQWNAAHARPGLAPVVVDVPGSPAEPGPRDQNCCVEVRRLDGWLDPEACFKSCFSECQNAFWLDSSLVAPGLSRFSFMGACDERDGRRISYSAQDRIVEERVGKGPAIRHSTTLFDFLEKDLLQAHADLDVPFDFVGGWVGYVGYECRADTGHVVRHCSDLPDAMLLYTHTFIAFDHEQQSVYALSTAHVDEKERAQDRVDAMVEALLWNVQNVRGETHGGLAHMHESKTTYSLTHDSYLEKVQQCRDFIREGQSYEICLTMNAERRTDCDPLALHCELRKQNPAPYAAYFRVGDMAVVCSSPERFLKIDRARTVESKPIKGTAPRGSCPQSDAELISSLRHSEKNRAENLMIVDLLRHEFGLLCEVGSVHVPKLMDIESYQTVHQMVSTVRGQLCSSVSAIDCVRQSFPAGSMTGAPKERTMALLNGLETQARGVYSGAFGYFSLNGCADLNVVIRTAVFSGSRVSVGMGGAITRLSNPHDEYEEATLKGRILLQALAASETELKRQALGL